MQNTIQNFSKRRKFAKKKVGTATYGYELFQDGVSKHLAYLVDGRCVFYRSYGPMGEAKLIADTMAFKRFLNPVDNGWSSTPTPESHYNTTITLLNENNGKMQQIGSWDMEKALTPCPFCGEQRAKIHFWNGGFDEVEDECWVSCLNCGCATGVHETLSEAITSWENRA